MRANEETITTNVVAHAGVWTSTLVIFRYVSSNTPLSRIAGFFIPKNFIKMTLNTMTSSDFSNEITTNNHALDVGGKTLRPERIDHSLSDITERVAEIVPPAQTPDELPNFNRLVRKFEKNGMDHAEAIEQAADAIEILKRIEADQPIFDTPLRQIQNAFTSVNIHAVSGVGV